MCAQFAYLFPGQGSQSLGMLSAMADAYPLVRATYAEASEVLGYDLWALIQKDPSQKLHLTEYTQLAMLTAGVAVYRVCREAAGDCLPDCLAGHSLGEYTALVCAEALAFTDAVRLVADRGRLMQEVVPVGQGAMAAILGMSEAAVQAVCQTAQQGAVVAPANFNAIGQVVVAGETAAVERAMTLAREEGARLVTKIPVSAPCHCALLEPMVDDFSKCLEKTPMRSPKFPVFRNIDAGLHAHPDDIRDSLQKQLYSPVRWVDTIQAIQKRGVFIMIESGPGRVLAGLNKRIDRTLSTYPVYDPDTLQHATTEVF